MFFRKYLILLSFIVVFFSAPPSHSQRTIASFDDLSILSAGVKVLNDDTVAMYPVFHNLSRSSYYVTGVSSSISSQNYLTDSGQIVSRLEILPGQQTELWRMGIKLTKLKKKPVPGTTFGVTIYLKGGGSLAFTTYIPEPSR